MTLKLYPYSHMRRKFSFYFDAFIAFRIGLDNIIVIVTAQIEADKSYTASAVLDGAELSYFGQEGLSEVVVSQPSAAVTFQFQCSAESTNVSNNHSNI